MGYFAELEDVQPYLVSCKKLQSILVRLNFSNSFVQLDSCWFDLINFTGIFSDEWATCPWVVC